LDIPIDIVHNSATVSPELGAPSFRTGLGIPDDPVLVALAGFVRRQKGWPELVEAAQILVDRSVPVHFVVVGGGVRPPAFFRTARGRLLELFGVLRDEESAILDMVRTTGLEPYFTFVPFTSDTSAMYRSVDIVAFPNQGVGLGRPVLEAAAYGKPVVASGSRDGGGVVIPDRTGILLQDPRPEAIADALQRLIEDPEGRRRMGEAARAHASVAFDPVRNARLVEQVYDRLLDVGPVRPPEPPARSEDSSRPAELLRG
jgi:glycosyltransferase involved in cell wall biosynthesis